MKKANSSHDLNSQNNGDSFRREIENSSCILIQSIERCLKKFRLFKYEPYEILSEVYIRAVKRLNQGEEIINSPAFIRSVAFNVIREWSRKEQKKTTREVPDPENFLEKYFSFFLDTDEIDDRYLLVQAAWKSLKAKEREILKLRILENLSWHQISQRLGRKEAALRQQGSRALKHLRDAYSSHCAD